MSDLQPHLSHKHDESNVAIQTDRSATPAAVPDSPEPEHLHTRDNPHYAVIQQRTPLTSSISSKLTMHLGLALEDSAVHYQAGDACGVIAQNDPALVDEILSLLPFDSDASVEFAKPGTVTVRDALLHHLQPTRLSRKIVHYFADRTGAKELQTLLLPEQASHLESFIYDRGLVDLLHRYPGEVTETSELAEMLPRLAPRLSSIS